VNILRVKTLIIMLLTLIITMASGSGCRAEGGAQGGGYQASRITFAKGDGGFSLTIKGNMPPTFTTYQLFDPLRVVVDIANATFAESLHLPIEVNQPPVAKISGSMLAEKEPVIAKLEVLLSADRQYTVKRSGNDITIAFANSDGKDSGQAALPKAASVPKVDAPDARAAEGRPEIYDLKINKEANGVKVLLVADGPIQKFTKVALPKKDGQPDRMYIDIPGVKAPSLNRVMGVDAGGVSRIRISDRAEGARFVFDSSMDRLFAYEAAPAPEGILVTIKAEGDPVAAKGAAEEKAVDPVAQVLASATTEASTKTKSPAAASKPLPKAGVVDEFAEAGYNRQKISVDFYKTNLHNVFRLMGEVGGCNIVVDESVTGVLTLSLREVPWDFLLDIIMNLKGLQKVERYNTIVISAKEKNFVWPEKITAKKELELETPEAQLAVTIDKQLNQPPAVIEAKMTIQRGNALAQEGKFKEALGLYQKALDKWPDNLELVKRMASLCLVDLGYNQAAVDYAKKALTINPKDQEAALQAAVGLANMHQPEARQYFEQAVSGSKPSRPALLSYASFQEENADLEGSLATLAKSTTLYGSSLEAMIARARIFDKQAKPDLAVAEYKAILYSGYDLAPDLAQYIKGRIAVANKQ
jgi:type IV pilus assembly protein PilQ